MGKYVINGGKKLSGEVFISGAKNSVLPILAGSILNCGVTVLTNVPLLSDVLVCIDILKELGAFVYYENNKMIIDSTNINNTTIPNSLVEKMRSSIIFLGSLLGRFKSAKIGFPGGCKLGKRPIDFHIDAFTKLGVNICCEEDLIIANCDEIVGNVICLPFASVGATQNIILCSVISKGKTVIKNPAKEPEIIDLQNFLNSMGADILGAGTDTIIINGVDGLKKYCEFNIMPDRIEAGTFLCLSACNKANITIKNIIPNHLISLIELLQNAGCKFEIGSNYITIFSPEKLKNIDFVKTAPYPFFPTDLQPQLMATLAIANGSSIIKEEIFEARNMHISELNKMGANITDNQNTFFVKGTDFLTGTEVFAKDLRGGASLIIAGLCASGKTTVYGAKYIKRGYENIENKLQNLGADIIYIED